MFVLNFYKPFCFKSPFFPIFEIYNISSIFAWLNFIYILDNSRTNFRHRNIDTSRPLTIFRDITLISKKEDFDENYKCTPGVNLGPNEIKIDKQYIIEKEIKRVLELFERKKVIVIPKTEVIEKPKTNSEPNGYSVIEYIQTKFERPRHYIVYSDKERQFLNADKEYEANINDNNFLKRHEEFNLTVEELEKMITILEHDVSGEMIPLERAEYLLCELFKCNFKDSPQKKQHFESVYKVIIINFDLILLYNASIGVQEEKNRKSPY